MVPPTVSCTLVTRTDLRDFAAGASSLDTLCSLAGQGVAVRTLSGLHAKIYIFDNSSALVTSANATASGLWHNRECGLSTWDTKLVRGLARSLLAGLGAEHRPRKVTLEELEALRLPLEAIKVAISKPIYPDIDQEAQPEFAIADKDELLKGFKGWQRLTLQGVLEMSADDFQLDELLEVCETRARKSYPRNQHVAAKLRQQLQGLRDLGIVEFVTPGHYRRTMNQQ